MDSRNNNPSNQCDINNKHKGTSKGGKTERPSDSLE